MRDFLPEDVRRREYVIGIIKRVYERYGFEPLETPALENLETLLGKYGEEGDKLIFKILKRGVHEITGEADLALRYDLTVPLARVVAEYQPPKLPRLFKRYQIQPVWRADRPARGRFREFYQCDVDSLGSTSPIVEAELCAAVADAMRALGFPDFILRLNHRGLLAEVLTICGVPADRHAEVLVILDKLDKVGLQRVSDEWVSKGGVTAAALEGLRRAFEPLPPNVDSWAKLEQIGDIFKKIGPEPSSIETLRQIRRLTERTAAFDHLTFDSSVARGLGYYTGAIMEVNVADLAGSLGGGGRYDNLVGIFLGQQIPACGFSLGLERILVVMTERGMFPPSLATSPADVMVATFDAAGAGPAMRLAGVMREAGLRVMVYPDPDRIGKQIKYADGRGIPFVAILGEDEINAGTVTVKNLAAKTQQTCRQDGAAAAILEGLSTRG
ncbi:MAG: histidine--tRNA ligase [Acidobacteria bacterium]|nr:histidine--tRNA ligase [Acidobacteriota bacterium]